MTPRICIEASPALQQQAGIGRYALSMIRALVNTNPHGNYAIAYNLSPPIAFPDPLGTMPRYSSTLGNKSWRIRNAITHFGAPPMDAFFDKVALYHSTGHLLPRIRHFPTVFTLHDLIPLTMPQYHRPLNRIFFQIMFPIFLRRANAIIAVSENTKNDAVNLLGTKASRITVIPEGISNAFRPVTNEKRLDNVRATYGLPETFILCVSTLEPRKNHVTLLRAFEILHHDYPRVGLIIAGARGWLYRDFLTKLETSSARDHVRLLGKVPEPDLPALLSSATIFAFPSLYEGFGLPPLEAMACSTPVVCSNASSLPEVVGDTALLHNPRNVDQLHEALVRLLRDEGLRRDLTTRGRKLAAAYTWRSAAKATQAVYDQVLNS